MPITLLKKLNLLTSSKKKPDDEPISNILPSLKLAFLHFFIINSALGLNKNFFDTLLLEGPSQKIKPIAEKNKINFNYIDDNHFSISINESTSKNEVQLIVDVIAKAIDKSSILVDKICNEIKII